MEVSCFYGGTVDRGVITGGDRYALEIWNEWASRAGCSLTVYASHWGGRLISDFGYTLRVVDVEGQPVTIGPSRLGYIKRFLKLAVSAMRISRADIAYSSSCYFYDLLPAIVVKLRFPKSRFVTTVFHLIPPPQRRTGSLLVNALAFFEQRAMIALVRRFADIVIVDNEDLTRDVAALGVPPAKIFLSPMGVRAVQQINGQKAKRFDAIYVGRFSGPKNVAGLIAAWRRVADAEPTATLALVGNNEFGFSAERLVSELGLEGNVKVLTGLSDAQVQEALHSADFFITASKEEGYGLSVLEALAAGLPCVTYDLPAFRYAFPAGRRIAAVLDEESLAAAALEMLRDPSLRSALKRDVRERLTISSWRDIAAKLWSVCV